MLFGVEFYLKELISKSEKIPELSNQMQQIGLF